ncbi:hypothetical protein [Actinacidiphila glaucinigra]|uniref:hypothetical protein n=1 Tax=Actinacidiphila glaucinigra TaxID=235986 RepID=UPI003D8FEDEE
MSTPPSTRATSSARRSPSGWTSGDADAAPGGGHRVGPGCDVGAAVPCRGQGAGAERRRVESGVGPDAVQGDTASSAPGSRSSGASAGRARATARSPAWRASWTA